MKSIEDCLDQILEDLGEKWHQWDSKQDVARLYLNSQKHLEGMGFTNVRLDHFFEFIRTLKTDGYVYYEGGKDFENRDKERFPTDTIFYQEAPIISAKGLIFSQAGGYKSKRRREK